MSSGVHAPNVDDSNKFSFDNLISIDRHHLSRKIIVLNVHIKKGKNKPEDQIFSSRTF